MPRVAGMATIPSRASTAPIAIASVLHQVSRLWLFLDRFESVPDYAGSEKVTVVRSQEVGDLRANGQLVGAALGAEPCVFFPVGDDIHYPHDYCATLESYLGRFTEEVVVGVHAGVLPPGLSSYRGDMKVLHYRSPQTRVEGVDILGTGTLAFRTAALPIDVRAWPDTNMVDLCFAMEARRRALPLLMIPRPAHWITALDENQEDSIWMDVQRDDSRQTALARELADLPRPRLPRRGLRRLRYREA